ncbi:c-type cytochrome [Rhodoferax lithotrophicus]|nr:c-type cytochrome [Rhodoferax sp. MIZ03]
MFNKKEVNMKNVNFSNWLHVLLAVGLTTVVLTVQAQAVDVAAAEDLIKVNKCGKCHSVDKQKDGPSFKKTAAKYKGKSDGEAKLYVHLTTGPTIEIDGVKEEHTKVKAKDDAAIKNLARYVLSR